MDFTFSQCYPVDMRYFNLHLRIISLICAFMLMSTFLCTGAYAQDTNTSQVSETVQEDDNNVDFSKIPDEYIAESKVVYSRCKSNASLYRYYDCKCRALTFLEHRIKDGPEAPRSVLEFRIQKACRDATEAAGAEYQSCLRQYNSMQPGTDPEKLCECYANRYVELIDLYAPTIQSKTVVPLKVRARIECENPALARKMYSTAGPVMRLE